MAARNSLSFKTISFIFIIALLSPFAYGRIIYVDDDAPGTNVGSSWENAIDSLQDALLLAYFYNELVEIRVATGIYTPDKGIGIMAGDREASFQLINGVTIKGGYAGLSDRPPDTRDIVLYETILSGDLAKNDGPNFTGVSENSYHVLMCNETDQTAVLDGITISAGGNTEGGGRSTISENTLGGGMYIDAGSPVLTDCTFSNNRGRSGAGVYNDSGSPSFINCTFSGNSADDNGGAMYNRSGSPRYLNCTFTGNSTGENGGGVYNDNSDPVITNCTFNENTGDNGGGIYNSFGNPVLADCDFFENSATESGGAVYIYGSILAFLNCTFKENAANRDGGGIFYDSSFARYANLTNCIFRRNSARNGGGIANGRSIRLGRYTIEAIEENTESIFLLNCCTFNRNFAELNGGGISFSADESIFYNRLRMINCILWGDTPEELSNPGESLFWDYSESFVVLYSNVQDGFPGEGNINMDPAFADPENGDYHLKSQAGRWDPESQNWVVDPISSPCIDSGDPDASMGLERFPNGGRINMGAYGGTPQASLTPLNLPLLQSQAYNPYPPNGATRVNDDVILSWTAGLNAILHDVYLGIDRNVVTNANTSSAVYRGRQAATSFNPPGDYVRDNGSYYWRIDEIASDGKIVPGEVWSFSTGPSTGPVKGRACFTRQNGVWIGKTLVPISKAATGQVVSTIGGLNTIEQVQEHDGSFTCYDITLESGKSIAVAENHLFMVESGKWISLKDLKAGMGLQTANGTIKIKSITKQPKPYIGKVYNLKIQGSDRYMVGEDAVIVRDY
jgi:hypothetical protein